MADPKIHAPPHMCFTASDVKTSRPCSDDALPWHHRWIQLMRFTGWMSMSLSMLTLMTIWTHSRSKENFDGISHSLVKTQLSLTNCATHLCKCNGVADIKTRPSPCVTICRIWYSSALNGVSIQENPRNWELRFLGMGGVADPVIKVRGGGSAPCSHLTPLQ